MSLDSRRHGALRIFFSRLVYMVLYGQELATLSF